MDLYINNFDVINLIKMLNDNRFEAYIVGGAIRDLILGKNPFDYDITTNAHPSDLKRIFSMYKLFTYGEKFGTVGVLVNENIIEITTYRSEANYYNNRKPEEVFFEKNIFDDLKRRDFTINAFAYNPITNEFIDSFNGLKDLDNNIIRTIGNPFERFKEDALRILRAIRFASELGFEIGFETENAIFEFFDNVFDTSYERRAIEIKKIIYGQYFKRIVIKYKNILEKLLIIFRKFNKYEYLDFSNKDIVLLILYFEYQDVLEIDNEKLLLSKKEVDRIKRIYKIIDDVDFTDEKRIRFKIGDNNKEDFIESLKLLKVYDKIDETEYNVFLSNVEYAFSKCYSIKDLDISGHDLKNFFVGKQIKDILNDILIAVINDEIENKKNSILEYIYKRIL